MQNAQTRFAQRPQALGLLFRNEGGTGEGDISISR